MRKPKSTLSWICHFCEKERGAQYIDFVTVPIEFTGKTILKNFNYCNDNKSCIEQAQSTIKSKAEDIRAMQPLKNNELNISVLLKESQMLENQILKYIDELTDQQKNKRLISIINIGRTNIQQGFMWLRKSIEDQGNY
jgi:hypothetical protein